MPLEFLCPHCNHQFRTPEEYSGKLTRCKHCGETMRIPVAWSFGAKPAPPRLRPGEEEEIVTFPEADAPGGSYPAVAAPAPVEVPESGFPQIQTGGPAKRPVVGALKPAAGPYFNLNRITGTLFIFGVVVVGLGIQQMMLASESSGTATKLSVQELLARGSKGNRFIHLTNAFLWTEGCVYQERSRGGSWSSVWIPVVDARDKTLAAGKRPTIRIILRTDRVSGPGPLAAFAGKQEFKGMLLTGYRSLASEERNLLAESFPEVSSGNVHIFDEGDSPPETGWMALLIVGGLGLLAAGAYLTFMVPPW